MVPGYPSPNRESERPMTNRKKWTVNGVRWKYLHCFYDRLGGFRVHVRPPGLPVVALPKDVGSPEFVAAYHAALKGEPIVPKGKIGAARAVEGSLDEVITAYYEKSAIWKNLHKGTQRGHRSVLERFRKDCGRLPIAGIDRQFISAHLALAPSPHVARNWL